PTRHMRWREPRPGCADRARELVDADQRADALTAAATERQRGRPQRRPHWLPTVALARVHQQTPGLLSFGTWLARTGTGVGHKRRRFDDLATGLCRCRRPSGSDACLRVRPFR